MVIFLVPVGRWRFELYSEPPEVSPAPPGAGAGFVHRWSHRIEARWQRLVDQARQDGGKGRTARLVDRLVCRLAENIAEQRTLWALRTCREATLVYPSSLDESQAPTWLRDLAQHARRHHGRWLIADLLLAAASGLLAIVPGPNLIAYYFLFRVVGHLQSWRGARRALDGISWVFRADESLAELAGLAEVPSAARASRVAAIAERLNLPQLSAFFDRVAASSS